MPVNAEAAGQQPAERKQRQLFMIRIAAPLEPPPPARPGFTMRAATPEDRDSYSQLFRVVFPEAQLPFDSLREHSMSGGFLVVANEAGQVIASAAAAIFPKDDHPGGASLQWVMADTAHRGLGLGRLAVHAATRMLAGSGQRYAYLSTDDWRVAAISIYLSLGWQPLLYEADMPARWSHVFTRLDRGFDAADWPTTPPR